MYSEMIQHSVGDCESTELLNSSDCLFFWYKI